jgi:hypothetical protein
MDRPISNGLRTTFLVHLVISTVLGAALLLVPGRALNLLGWVPDWVQLPNSDQRIPGQTFVDPVVTRILGAALLALALSSLRGWSGSAPARKWNEVAFLVELETVFNVLGALAILAGVFLTNRGMPVIGWVLFVVQIAFAVAFGLAWRQSRT